MEVRDLAIAIVRSAHRTYSNKNRCNEMLASIIRQVDEATIQRSGADQEVIDELVSHLVMNRDLPELEASDA